MAGVREASRCQEQFVLMVGDLFALKSLQLEIQVSCEATGRGQVVENLPLSSQ